MLSKNKVMEQKPPYTVVKNDVNDLGATEAKKPVLPIIQNDAHKDILDLLTTSLVEFCSEIDAAYQEKDVETLLKITHRTHGALCYTRTPHLKEAVKSMEFALKTGEFTLIEACYQDVLEAIQIFNEAYKDKIW